MNIKALIFDVDGTLADTEEAHRRAFNSAFERHGLGWNWSAHEYARLLPTTGGKERLGAYIDSLALDAAERRALQARIPAIHATKTENLHPHGPRRAWCRCGRASAACSRRPSVPPWRLAIASTTTFANIEALLRSISGRGALDRFSRDRRRRAGAAQEAGARHLSSTCSSNCGTRRRTASPSRTRPTVWRPPRPPACSPWSPRASGRASEDFCGRRSGAALAGHARPHPLRRHRESLQIWRTNGDRRDTLPPPWGNNEHA